MPTKMGIGRVVLMSDSSTPTAEYNELLDSIKRTLAAGRLRAARAVNNVLIETYWEIGHDIIRRQQEQGWGAQVCAGYRSGTCTTWRRLPRAGQPQLCSSVLHNCPGAT